jgi:hypothetical protein
MGYGVSTALCDYLTVPDTVLYVPTAEKVKKEVEALLINGN